MKSTLVFAFWLLVGIGSSIATAEEWLVSDADEDSSAALSADFESRRWMWYAGAEATYLSLNAPAMETDRFARSDLIDFGFEAAPRIWLGAQGRRGWGGQVRYWQYDADA